MRIIGGVLASLVIVGIAVIAIIALVRTFGPVTVTDLRVCGTLDLSCVDSVVPQPWFVPQPGPVIFKRDVKGVKGRKNHGARTPSFDYEAPPFGPSSIILGNSASSINVRFPSRMLGHEAQTYYIFSNTSFAHTVSMTDSFNAADALDRCPSPTFSTAAFDRERLYNTIRFDGAPGSYVVFRVVDCGSIMMLSTRGVDVCTEDLTACVNPTIDDFAVSNINITVSLAAGNIEATTLEVSESATIANATIPILASTTATIATATITTLTSTTATIITATINTLTSASATIVNLTATTLSAVSATITTLVTTTFTALSATITSLSATSINTVSITSDMAAYNVLAHIVSGAIPATHSMQTLANDPGAPPAPAVTVLQNATLGVVSTGSSVIGGNLVFKAIAGGPWNVRDLAADPYTAAGDTAGTRVLQSGYPEVYGGTGTCTTDLSLPGESAHSVVEISSANFQGGLLTLNLRSGSEQDFDFVEVRHNGNLLHRVSGAGPSASDAYVEGTLVINMKGTDTVQIAFLKDGSCWGGYDLVYIWATLSTSPHIDMHFPVDLAPYVGKDIQVCSLDNGEHTINLDGGVRHFDPNSYWKVIKFQANGVDSCCATFKILTADRVSVISRDACTVFCADTALFHCVDPLRAADTSPFHGTWKTVSRGELVSYLELDTAKVPMVGTFHRGTVNNPRESSYTISYYGILAGTFSQFNDTNIHDPEFRDVPEVITFQPGGQTLVLYEGYDTYGGPGAFGGLWEKVSSHPAYIPEGSETLTNLVPDDPVAIFRAYFDYFVFAAYGALAKETADENWIGYPAAKALMDTIISTGTGVIPSTIVETRVTHSSNAAEEITEFRTQNYHHVAPPSRVLVSGFTGACTALNGDFLVAIAATNNQNAPDATYMDYGPTYSARTVHHKLGVFLDSSAIPVFPGTQIANCTGSTPIIEVSYGPITSSSSYIQTVGAIQYWFYEAVKVALHTRPFLFFDESTTVPRSGVAHVREDWSDIVADLAAGADALTALSHFRKLVASRDNTATSSFYPVGAAIVAHGRWFSDFTADRRGWQGRVDLTGQYGIRPDREASIVMFSTDSTERATHWKNIVKHNYLDSNTAYPAWKVTGTTRTHLNNLFAQAVYPGGGGDEFDTVMVPHGTLPPTDYSYMWVSTNPNGGFTYTYDNEYNFINEIDQDAVFMGRINTAYTGGLNIGYMRFTDTQFYDVAGFMFLAELCPTGLCDPLSPRHNQEAAASVYAKFMQYLLIDLDCEHVIIDIRGNQGGAAVIQTLVRGFFGDGDEQIIAPQKSSRRDNGNGALIDLSGLLYANDAQKRRTDSFKALPGLSETNYPGSVLTNGEVIFLTDTTAGSGGDVFPNNFLGSAYDGQLGNNTQVTMIGSIDGRITGSSCSFSVPTSRDSPLLKNSAGVPITTVSSGVDCGAGYYRGGDGSPMGNRHLGLEIDPASGLTGLAGGNPLPQDWDELVYKDLGYVTNTRPVLAGWTKPQTPKNVVEVNPLSMTSGSNIVTVTMSAPHGFTTGDDVALGNTAIPVPATAGISSNALTGGHIITVTGATTFTFAATSFATYPGYNPVPATSTVAGAGGSIRITNRSQWRDAWLEASIETVVAQAKKKRSVSDPTAHKARKEARKAKLIAQREAHKARRNAARFDIRSANKQFGRSVACPANVALTHVNVAPATRNVTFDVYIESEIDRIKEIQRIRSLVETSLHAGLQSGGLCLDTDGALMATPTNSNLVKVVGYDPRTHGKMALNEAARKKTKTTTTKKNKKVSPSVLRAQKLAEQAARDTAAYDACVKACGARTSPTYRQCTLQCASMNPPQ